jgi:hypothetical protein
VELCGELCQVLGCARYDVGVGADWNTWNGASTGGSEWRVGSSDMPGCVVRCDVSVEG